LDVVVIWYASSLFASLNISLHLKIILLKSQSDDPKEGFRKGSFIGEQSWAFDGLSTEFAFDRTLRLS
jgi:hypothetical protein